MKKLFTCIITMMIFTAVNVYAQLTPQPSSTQSIVQDFGLGKISLVYSRPDVRGRKIFGGMEPYGKVWRTGTPIINLI